MEGIGNDFVVVDEAANAKLDVSPELARTILDRRWGVGGDQLLWVRKPKADDADSRMEILNPDGSRAEMCGNGIRAFALYLYRRTAMAGRSAYRIETLAGIKTVEIRGKGESIRVDMGAPLIGALAEALDFGEAQATFCEVNMGNPHAVVFTDDLSCPVEKISAEAVGHALENHSRFLERTNVEFVKVMGSALLKVRVWERGTGLTLACGTGACASAVAAIKTGRIPGPAVKVELPGGVLEIHWDGGSVFMEGPAREVFRGEMLFD